MKRTIKYKIPEEFDGKKVIAYLKGEAKISARLLRSLKRTENGITLNGEHIRTVDILHTGDELKIEIPCPDGEIEPMNIPIDVIYEDDDLIAVNKSPFLASTALPKFRKRRKRNILQLFRAKRKNSAR